MKTLFFQSVLKVCFSVVLGIALFCCEKDRELSIEKTKNEGLVSRKQPDQAFPGEKGETVKFKYNGEDVFVRKVNNTYVMMGDILLSDEQVAQLRGDKNARTATSDFTRHWPSGIVYYTINSSLPNQQRVTNAISHWESSTTLDFQVRTNQSNYIEFVDAGDDECSSFVGQIGGRQEVKLGDNCTTRSAIHEIGHAIGFYHEQSRADAGNFVEVLFENLPNDDYIRDQFRTYTALGKPGFHFGAFDFSSVMLYHSLSFSTNGLPTIRRIDDSWIFSNDWLSAGDIETAKAIYGPPYAKVRKVQISYDGNSSGTTSYYYEEADYFVDFFNDKQCTSPYTGNAPRVVNVNKQLNQANAQGGYSSSLSNLQYHSINGESGSIWLGRYNNYENTNYGDVTSGEYVNFAVTSPNKGNY
ncbi:M12 family metallopeptidase [Dyadobacter sp. CY261]|uniref:M12 family metallopeptidase n=1 Tax=Dyadobacter sp. CY261 TaxID=2907203 RepID=UPI001F373B30|nr:M12 family metallopeptidase [Dyadobacter sp. CY261]MCF0073131.1 M12 family metallopeptidase [Dyadobacter sp. CY261]